MDQGVEDQMMDQMVDQCRDQKLDQCKDLKCMMVVMMVELVGVKKLVRVKAGQDVVHWLELVWEQGLDWMMDHWLDGVLIHG